MNYLSRKKDFPKYKIKIKYFNFTYFSIIVVQGDINYMSTTGKLQAVQNTSNGRPSLFNKILNKNVLTAAIFQYGHPRDPR